LSVVTTHPSYFRFYYQNIILIHSKNAGLFHPKFGSNMDKPKRWVKNVIEKITVESES